MYTFGRGSVLLVSFPLMALMLLMTGVALYVAFLGLVALFVRCMRAWSLADGCDTAGYRNRTRLGLGSLRGI